MWSDLVVTSAPAASPLTLAQLVAHCRAPEDQSDDAILTDYQAVAVAQVEAQTGTRLVTQTVRAKADSWADMDALPCAPVQSVMSVTYLDDQGDEQTLSTDVYEARLEGLTPALTLKSAQVWPTIQPGSRITLTAVVGYGAAGTQPANVLHALRLMVGDFYAFRETAQVGSVAGSIPSAARVSDLLANHTRTLP